MWTKGEIIKEAFAELGLGAYAYSLQPEDMQTALRRMNLMLAEWDADGINVGYTVVDEPNDDTFTDDSGIGTEFIRGVICSLAVEIAPNYGKTVSRNTASNARRGKAKALRVSAPTPPRKIDYTAVPLGAGNRGQRFIAPEDT